MSAADLKLMILATIHRQCAAEIASVEWQLNVDLDDVRFEGHRHHAAFPPRHPGARRAA